MNRNVLLFGIKKVANILIPLFDLVWIYSTVRKLRGCPGSDLVTKELSKVILKSVHSPVLCTPVGPNS